MTDKERLEEIKKELELDCSNIFCVVNKDDIKLLINLIEELEEERDEWKDTAQSYYMTNQELREQNKCYREALEFYAGGNHYSDKLYDDKIILLDNGEKARQALEESK